MNRIIKLLLTISLLAPGIASAQTAPMKVLRVAFPVAETGFDPARIVDLYSRTVTPHIFEGLYQYDHLARPAKIKPLTADGMPQVSDDFRSWTVKIKPGIYFAERCRVQGQEARAGRGRLCLLVSSASSTRANKSPVVAGILETKFVGLAALRDDALKNKKAFDYDTRDRRHAGAGSLYGAVQARGAAAAHARDVRRR